MSAAEGSTNQKDPVSQKRCTAVHVASYTTIPGV